MFFSSIYATCLAYLMLLDLDVLITFGEGRHENYGAPHYATFLASWYLFSLKSKIVLKHPWPVIFS
jgi:hypothetical protein